MKHLIPSLLLLLGLYFPSSVSTRISVLSALAYVVCIALLGWIWAQNNGHIPVSSCLVLTSIVALPLLFTAFSPLSTLTLGAASGYLVLSILLMVNLNGLTISPRLWIAVNVMNIAAGLAIVLGVDAVHNLILSHYAMAYDDLLPMMLEMRKPVLTFGTHSLAAFFLYLFFWINLEAFKAKGRKLFLAFSICYLFLVLCLTSVSAVALSLAGFAQLAYLAVKPVRRKVLWAYACLVLVISTAAFTRASFDLTSATGVAKEILGNKDSGFMGRFLSEGTMHYDLAFIGQHPFSPVGFSFREGFMFGDSGWVEYMLRGSIPLLVLIFGGLYYFLRRNLTSRAQAHFLFAAIVFFELGMTTLTFIRMLYLLPVFVIVLNNVNSWPLPQKWRRITLLGSDWEARA
jgi:hypothetical protein